MNETKRNRLLIEVLENHLINKWYMSGLLEGLVTSQKLLLAEIFEDIANRVIDEKPNENFAHVVLPVVRRIYNHGTPVDYDKIYEIWKELYEPITDYEVGNYNRKMCSMIEEKYIEKYQ